MARGGARNRSGPSADPRSARSDRRGVSFSALPAEGYSGEVPDYPVPGATGRELEVWAALWATPQAAAWSVQSWRWAHVADLVRMMVHSEDPKAQVGIWTHIRQARADLGLTPAGLKENGWAIAVDELSERREPVAEVSAEEVPQQRRLRAVSGD
jgi:hypothetical protein